MFKKKDKSEGQQAEGGKKSKKKLIIILVPVLLLAVGGFLMFGKGGSTAEPVLVPGKTLKLEPIYLNLSDGRYLKLGMALQESTLAEGELDGSKALDAAIALFSQVSMAQLSTPEGRDAIKERLIKKIHGLYGHEVITVYYTEFVMQ